MKLTKSVVDRIQPPASGQAFHRDTVLTGFGLRVTAKGAKSFVVETRVSGRVRRKTLGRYGPMTVEQARKEAQRFLGEVAGGGDPIEAKRIERDRGVTLGEVFELYLATRKGLTETTVADYRRVMREALPDWQERPLASIGKDAVAKRHAELGQRGKTRANHAMTVLKALFNFAHHQYEDRGGHSLFPENPVTRLSHTRAWYPVERRRTVITASQLPDWFAAVQTLRADDAGEYDRTVGDLLLLLLFTGLRRGEAMPLRWECVDFGERTLRIPDTKNRRPLTLPLPDYAADLLVARRELVDGPYVFPGTGAAGHLVEPRPQMRRVTKASGVEFTLHDLRRTFATIAESLDIPVYAIKRLVNHSMDHDVTAGYVVMDTERLREPMERIADFILRSAGCRDTAQVLSHRRRA